MKKVLLILAFIAGGLLINACTQDSTDEELELLSPDGNEHEDPDNRGNN